MEKLQKDIWIPVLDPELKEINLIMKENASILQPIRALNQNRISHAFTLLIKIQTKETDKEFKVKFFTHDNYEFSKV